jgi:hypothetical protein
LENGFRSGKSRAKRVGLEIKWMKEIFSNRTGGKMKRKIIALFMSICSFAFIAPPVATGQETQKFSAVAYLPSGIGPAMIGGGRAMMPGCDIYIERYSSDDEAKVLAQALLSGGQEALLEKLQDMTTIGRVSLTGRVGQFELKFVRSRPGAGGRQVIAVSDRPIGFLEAYYSGRSMDYTVGIMILQLKQGKKREEGTGTLIYGAKIKVKEGNTIEIENYSISPVQLRNVRGVVKGSSRKQRKEHVAMSKRVQSFNYKSRIAIAVVLILLSPAYVSTQSSGTKGNGEAAQRLNARFGLTSEELKTLSPFIQQKVKDLQGIYTRYNASDETYRLLAWRRPYIWQELMSSRKKIERRMRGKSTQSQVIGMEAASSKMESEMLSQMREDQVWSLADKLKLQAGQGDEIDKVISTNNERKAELLVDPKAHADNKYFEKELNKIGEVADAQIAKVLTASQIAEYEEQTQVAGHDRFGLWGAAPTTGDTPQSVDINNGNKKPSIKKQKRGEFFIAPIPMINPTLENGLAIAGGYLFQLDKNDDVSPTSVVGGAYFRTSNGSSGFGGGGQLYLKEDRYRILVLAGKATINLNFFGIGFEAGDSGRSIPISLKSRAFLADGLVRVHGRWYVGARYRLLKMNASLNLNEGDAPAPDDPVIPPLDIKLRTAGLGPHIKYDGANDFYYPTNGSIFDVRIGFFGKAVGGNRTYQSYELSYNRYMSFSKKQVLAMRVAGCSIGGRAPFYDLCTLGLRGYEAGQYLDKNMMSGQVEFRQEFWWRLGFVAFAGAGAVARKLDRFELNKALPSGGFGMRFRLTKQNHLNLRVDYAWGKNSSGLHIGINEAF